jgi:hypothetical protein
LTKNVISLLIVIFRRWNANFTPFYTQNVEHSALCIGTSPAALKSQSFVDFDENSVISFRIEIFRRLNVHFIPFYTQNVVHTALCVGTGPAARKTQSFVDFDENSVISFRIEIFRRLSAHFTPILQAGRIAQRVMRRNKPCSSQIAIFCRFWRKLIFRFW